MAVERHKIEEILNQLPDELQHEVLKFAEFLLEGKSKSNGSSATPSPSSFFGSWDSGSSNSADNDRIDRDLTHEYSNTHDTD
jgi:hypothetical protein